MLKQSPSRNKRSKEFKVKHILQICLLVVLCIWLLNQLKSSHEKNLATINSTAKISLKAQDQLEILSLGRKGLRPQGDDGEETSEIKSEDVEDEGRGGGDDEIDGHDQDRAEEEEAEEIEDLIDEDDRESSEEIQEKGNQLEDQTSPGNGAKNEIGSTREEHHKNGDTSISLFHKIRTIRTELETGDIRKH